MATNYRNLLLGLIAALAAAPGAAADAPARYGAPIAEYQRLSPAERHAWLQHLLIGRGEAAARTAMSADEFRRLQERDQNILERSAAGRELSPEGLARLLAEVDRAERLAIEKLRRDFAFATARAYHDNRAAFDRRSEAWRRIEQHWNQTGQSFSWQPRILRWLDKNAPRQTETIARRPPPPAIAPQANTSPRRAPQTANRPIQRTPASAGQPSGPRVDQGELLARIAGYNMALARMIVELNEQQHWTVLELDRAAGELSELTSTRADLAIYRELVPPQDRKLLPTLDSPQTAISLLARRTADRRRQLESPDHAATPEYAAWELRRLERVSQRLASFATSSSGP